MLDDKTIESFEMYMKKYPELYKNLVNISKRYITSQKPIIVDLGSGPGLLIKELNKEFPNGMIIGIDPVKKMLDLAKSNIKNNSDSNGLVIGLSEKIPLKEKSVDVVITRFSLPYWNDPILSFKEINRVLKPNGSFIIEALNKNYSKWKLFLTKIHMFFNEATSNVIRYHLDTYKIAYTSIQIRDFLNNSGFKISKKDINEKDWKFLIIGIKI